MSDENSINSNACIKLDPAEYYDSSKEVSSVEY